MLFIKIVGYEVNLAKWPKGTFITNTYSSYNSGEIIVRLGHYELEVCKVIPTEEKKI